MPDIELRYPGHGAGKIALQPISVVGKSLAVEWAIRQTINLSTDLQWQERIAVGRSLALQWHTRSLVNRSASLQWQLRQSIIGRTVDLRWITEAFPGNTEGSIEAVASGSMTLDAVASGEITIEKPRRSVGVSA